MFLFAVAFVCMFFKERRLKYTQRIHASTTLLALTIAYIKQSQGDLYLLSDLIK